MCIIQFLLRRYNKITYQMPKFKDYLYLTPRQIFKISSLFKINYSCIIIIKNKQYNTELNTIP